MNKRKCSSKLQIDKSSISAFLTSNKTLQNSFILKNTFQQSPVIFLIAQEILCCNGTQQLTAIFKSKLMNDLYNADSPDLISIQQHSLQVIPPPHQVSNRIKFRIDQYGKLMLLFIKGFDEYIKLTIQFLFIIFCLTTYSFRSIQRSKKKTQAVHMAHTSFYYKQDVFAKSKFALKLYLFARGILNPQALYDKKC